MVKVKKPIKAERKIVTKLGNNLINLALGLFILWIGFKVLIYNDTLDIDLWFKIGVILTCMFTVLYGIELTLKYSIESIFNLLKITGYKIIKVEKRGFK